MATTLTDKLLRRSSNIYSGERASRTNRQAGASQVTTWRMVAAGCLGAGRVWQEGQEGQEGAGERAGSAVAWQEGLNLLSISTMVVKPSQCAQLCVPIHCPSPALHPALCTFQDYSRTALAFEDHAGEPCAWYVCKNPLDTIQREPEE